MADLLCNQMFGQPENNLMRLPDRWNERSKEQLYFITRFFHQFYFYLFLWCLFLLFRGIMDYLAFKSYIWSFYFPKYDVHVIKISVFIYQYNTVPIHWWFYRSILFTPVFTSSYKHGDYENLVNIKDRSHYILKLDKHSYNML